MTEEEKRNQVNITKTILSQIFAFNENLFEELNVRSVSPMTEGKHQRGGAIIHLPNNAKVEIRLTWVDLYHVKYYTNVESGMVLQENGSLNYEASGNCVYDLDDFERQMPDNAKVLVRDSITDERGTRFMLIGKLYEKNNL